MRAFTSCRILFALALLLVPFAPPPLAAETLLVVEAKLPLGAVRGRIDHLAFDPGRRRLLVAELGNGSVAALDLATGKVGGRITGLAEPQGVAYAAAGDLVYVASAGDGTLRRYRAADLAPAGVVKLGDDADNLRVTADGARLVAGFGSGALAIVDAASASLLATVKLPTHPESFQLDRAGARAWVNLPEAGEVAAVDLASGARLGDWRFPAAAQNFPMALDEAGGQAIVVFRRPPVLAAFDLASGHVAAQLPTCGDADDVFLDAKRQRLYVSCGEGAVAVLGRKEGRWTELGRVATSPGARTSLFVPALDRLYVAARARGGEKAAVWVLRPGEG